MEYRRLISFGKSSFVVSLPKEWIGQNSLKKGDLVYLQESGPNLLLSKKDSDEKVEEREKIIYVDGKSAFTIGREVCSTYIQNYPRIILRGKEIKNKVKELQGIVQSMIALEIMEQTSDSIIAKDFLNMDSVSVEELIRKMDLVTRTMMKEAQQIFEEDNYESLNERDQDVNRLYFLLYRSILYNLRNPMKALRNFKLSGLDILRAHFIGFYVEAIADEVRRTARHTHNLKMSPQTLEQVQQYLLKMYDYYTTTMKAAYNKDAELAFKQAELKQSFDKELLIMEEEVQKTPGFNKVLTRLQRMTSLIHNLGRVLYTMQ
ncbi:MAG: phosphate uptake regulator PhoU [Nanoarchaeota archaeon]